MSAFPSLAITKDGFAFDACTGESYTLNPCGRLIMEKLQQGETRQQIANFLASEFGIPQTTAERDVADFCGQLHILGLQGV